MRFFIKAVIFVAMIFYLLILSKLILFKYLTIPDIINHFIFNFDDFYWNSDNFIPFNTIIYYLFLADINFNIRVENLIGNIVGFVPFGFMLPLLSKRFHSFKNMAITTFCLSLAFELVQFIFRFGSFDVDDLILNTLGGVIGYLVIYAFFIFIKYIKQKKVSERVNLK
jgi:glycopeptide antibiotics resistance protein